MRRILIMGATSAIAEATAREFAALGAALFLVGRDADRLAAIADDLRLRGAAQVEIRVLDARELAAYPQLVDTATARLGGLDTALLAHGTLTDQAAAQASIELLADEFRINALSHMALCTELGNRFESQGHGCIAVISSVAGDRGRQSNYVYGAAKAAVTAFTSGLRQRLHPKGVTVLTIKPGFVDTPMTAAFRKGPLWATPAQVGKAIARAVQRGTPVLYTPWFWWPIMQIIRNIPEAIFRKLRL
ncbi:MAG: short-chain dehydrogenase [Xanthomonadaceae bacterium]|nr:short-chain dehydrogenase [Xanthomonadaceae bacterium]